jgi:phospholipase/carboxylesterase
MNRIAPPSVPFATHSSPFKSYDYAADAANSSASTTTRRPRPIRKAAPGIALFAPVHYERRYAYPLLSWLHGEGSSERELRHLMPNVSVRNYVGAAARGVSRRPMGERASGEREMAAGFAWPQTDEGVDAALESVSECIEHAQRRFNIHPRRIFLAGQGTGGTMALRLALQFSLPLAGAVSLGGALPRGNCPLSRVNQVRSLPLMLMCCRESQAYPPHQVAGDLRLLHAAGCQLAIREYLCGDEWFTDMFDDMDKWLMEKVCGAPSTPAVV